MNKRSNVNMLLFTPFKSNTCGLAGFFSPGRGGGSYLPEASLLEPPCERIIDLLVQQSDTDLKPLITGRDQQGSSFIPWHTACTALTAFLPSPSLWSLRCASPHVSHHRRTAKTDGDVSRVHIFVDQILLHTKYCVLPFWLSSPMEYFSIFKCTRMTAIIIFGCLNNS